jgi:hypothetical protein
MLMVRITIVIIVLHLLQILLWAGFYRWSCFPSWQSAFYFSTASYSTVGAGDLLLLRSGGHWGHRKHHGCEVVPRLVEVGRRTVGADSIESGCQTESERSLPP